MTALAPGRVLVTGASGLIGRQMAAALAARGYEAVSVSRGQGGDIRGDLLADPEAVVRAAGAASLVHLAWHDGSGDRWNAPVNLDWVGASLRLMRAFAEAGGRRAVMVGSCAEYGWNGAGRLAETSPLTPATLYGAAKAATGIAARAGAGRLGLSLAWARPFFVYGPGEPRGRLLGDLIHGLAAGQEVACTDGLQRRDFLHSADVAGALVALLASPVEGAVNIGSGRAVALRDMIGQIAALLGGAGRVRLGARPRPDGDPALIEADVTRLAEEVGFRPRFDLQAGLVDVLRAEGALR
ncbi:NAD-dependent epimerase/dehydratase family protein [Albidovulum sp.]|uniref:NAD-dependent epimerase/dehydratase family protein n=1 Tax=Albidovulum sp. TaxID=1872424 RepID=UPI001DF9C12B|nr:NAD(P)-dependent oxidoreductase [Paracoccaceae bacterium]